MERDVFNLLKEAGAGRVLRVRRQTAGTYSPSSGLSGASTTNYDVTGVIINYSDKARDNTLIQAGDRKAIISAESIGFAITKDDAIIDGTTVYKIVDVHKIMWKNNNLVYICQVRI